MSMSYRKKIKLYGKPRKINISRRIWGFFLFLTSVLFMPLVFGITYYQNRKYKYTLKEFWQCYKDALKDMLKGTWENLEQW